MMIIKMRTAALIVMLKTGMKRIAKTIITTTTVFIIAIRLYSIVINEKYMFVKYFTVYIHNIPLLFFLTK